MALASVFAREVSSSAACLLRHRVTLHHCFKELRCAPQVGSNLDSKAWSLTHMLIPRESFTDEILGLEPPFGILKDLRAKNAANPHEPVKTVC